VLSYALNPQYGSDAGKKPQYGSDAGKPPERHLVHTASGPAGDDVFYLFLQKQTIGAKLLPTVSEACPPQEPSHILGSQPQPQHSSVLGELWLKRNMVTAAGSNGMRAQSEDAGHHGEQQREQT
jgi:hypothetical protein